VNWKQNLRVQIAARLLARGEVIAYPTEAVWGLGCDPMARDAVAALLALKQRPEAKGLILIAARPEQLLPFIGDLSSDELARLASAGPVPTTWVVPASDLVPSWLNGGRSTLAVRVTRHPLAAALCAAFGGPIVSTSANPQGKPPAKTALKVRCYFPADSVHVVAGPLGKAAKPSEIRDLRSGEILRPGT
jgi:L-threonylcarbamoyladenylate synthase